jgi:hypothetical protein
MNNDSPEDSFVNEDTRIQVLDNITLLPRADKEQRGAFIRDERTLVVWTNNFNNIVPIYEEFEDKLISLVWRESPRYKIGKLVPIVLSVYSLKKAMRTHARQGGMSSILMHNDGLQLISDAERDERIALDHNTR